MLLEAIAIVGAVLGQEARTRPAAPVPATPPALHGIVVDPSGKPVEGATVGALPANPTRESAPLRSTTDARGTFAIKVGRADSYRVWVDARGFAPQMLKHVRPGSTIQIKLWNGRSIEGSVRDAASGRPVAKARVEGGRAERWPDFWDPGLGFARAETDAEGRFRLDGLERGPVTITASARGYGRASVAVAESRHPVELALRPGASLFGHVLDAAGRAVAGAAVRLDVTGDDNPFLSARRTHARAEKTDRRGAFAVFGVEPGEYRVIARHADLGLALSDTVEVRDGGEASVELRLSAGTRVAGRLISNEGGPLAGKARLVRWEGEALPGSLAPLLATDSGPDGAFGIEGVPAGAYEIELSARGFKAQRTSLTVRARDAQVSVGDIALESGLSIRGRVLDGGGRAVEGASVVANPASARLGMGAGLSGPAGDQSQPDGSFVLSDLEGGSYVVRATLGETGSDEETVEAGSSGVQLLLKPGGAVSGFVVDGSGRPLEYFRVTARPVAGERRFTRARHEEFADGTGRFLLGGAAEGETEIEAWAPDKVPASATVNVGAGRTVDAGTIRLSDGGTIRGSVTDTKGRAVGGAAVRVQESGRRFFYNYPGHDASRHSEADGSFEIKGIRPGTVDVSADHPDFAPGRVGGVEVEPAKGPSEVRLELGAGGRIEGTARRRDGLAIAGAFIVLHSPKGGPGFPRADHNPLAGDGSFTIDHVPPGPVDVVLMTGADGAFASRQRREVEVRDGETARVDFSSREILVSGRVTRLGSPLAGARVAISSGDFRTGMYFAPRGEPMIGPQPGVAVTREDGSYELLVEQPGKADVEITSLKEGTRYPRREVEIPDADTFVLDLNYTGAVVSGVVVDASNDSPLARVTITAYTKHKDGSFVEAVTGAGGRFELLVDPGDVDLSARAEGYAPTRQSLELGPGGVADVRLALDKGLSIRGKVVDEKGRAVADASVFAVPVAGSLSAGAVERTSLSGVFWLSGLTPGQYELEASGEPNMFGRASGVEADTQGVTVVLRPGGRITVRVLGADGLPVTGSAARVASVDGRPSRGAFYQYFTKPDGIIELGAPAGTIEIRAWKGDLEGRATAVLGASGSAAVEVSLARRVEAKRP